MRKTKCIVSMTADPMTVGHRDIIARAAKMYDLVYILVAKTSAKPGHLLTYEDKVEHIIADLKADKVFNIKVLPIERVLVDQAKKLGVNVIVRGLRNEQDLIYEMDMSSVNRLMNGEIETIYLPCKPELSFVSSSMVRELCRLGKWSEAAKFTSYDTTCLMKRRLTTVVGLTGGIGCGKSEARKIFEDNGWEVIDCDDFNRRYVLGNHDTASQIIHAMRALGYDVVSKKSLSYEIDPVALAKAVFHNKKAKVAVEKIAWPKIFKFVKWKISAFDRSTSLKFLVEVPLLFEKGTEQFLELFDKTVCICADEKAQMKRLTKNRKMSFEDARARLNSQMPLKDKMAKADICIDNSGTKADLRAAVEKVINVL